MAVRGALQLQLDQLRKLREDPTVSLVQWLELVQEWTRRVNDAGLNPKAFA